MSPVGDTLKKIMDAIPGLVLAPGEAEALRLWANRTQSANAQLSGILDAVGNVDIAFPVGVIFSEVLDADAASKTIIIPSAYRHIILFGSGRVDGAVYNMSIRARINDDNAGNYSQQHINAAGVTATGAQGLAQTEMLMGDFAGASAPAGECGSFVSFVFHAQGSFWKNAFGLSSLQDSGTTMLARVATNFYTVTDPISSIVIFPDSGNLLAGTAITAIGII